MKDIVAKSGLRLRMKEKKKPVVKENKDLERRYASVLSSHTAFYIFINDFLSLKRHAC